MNEEKTFTPALGYAALTPLYDLAIAALTRENLWRDRLVGLVDPARGEDILDVGCGTGSLALRLKQAAPEAKIIAIDPDPRVLARAKEKADKRGLSIEWQNGFLTTRVREEFGLVSKIVSSLVFHQTPLQEKKDILATMRDTLQPGGTLHIADYGLQRSSLMRALFRVTVQAIDGIEDTQPNADGILPKLIEEVGFNEVLEITVIPTATGSISIYKATK